MSDCVITSLRRAMLAVSKTRRTGPAKLRYARSPLRTKIAKISRKPSHFCFPAATYQVPVWALSLRYDPTTCCEYGNAILDHGEVRALRCTRNSTPIHSDVRLHSLGRLRTPRVHFRATYEFFVGSKKKLEHVLSRKRAEESIRVLYIFQTISF